MKPIVVHQLCRAVGASFTTCTIKNGAETFVVRSSSCVSQPDSATAVSLQAGSFGLLLDANTALEIGKQMVAAALHFQSQSEKMKEAA